MGGRQSKRERIPSIIEGHLSYYSKTVIWSIFFPFHRSGFEEGEAMADLILGSIVSSITEQATSLISLEIGGAWGAKDELKKLGKTVEAIEAVLAEAEKRKVEVEPIKLWLKRLWNAVYEADDLLDDYSTEIKRRAQMRGGCNNRMMKEVRIFFSSSNRVLYNFKMAHRVKSIRETLDVINKERQEYNLGQDNTGNAAQDGRRYDL
ncbi:hypothetical protein SAY86_010162 [Trapa natans]|uniref:Disease resistance N-terminal domain-containing protein n=1 Tax=Trapa natans TaxID=22666 RepID=A0AAN7KXA6_TRANT|nr:hypothetical protein SAY86_010162 [Trapa natans]